MSPCPWLVQWVWGSLLERGCAIHPHLPSTAAPTHLLDISMPSVSMFPVRATVLLADWLSCSCHTIPWRGLWLLLGTEMVVSGTPSSTGLGLGSTDRSSFTSGGRYGAEHLVCKDCSCQNREQNSPQGSQNGVPTSCSQSTLGSTLPGHHPAGTEVCLVAPGAEPTQIQGELLPLESSQSQRHEAGAGPMGPKGGHRPVAAQDSRLVRFSSSTTPRSPGGLRPQSQRLRHSDSTTTP